MTAVLEVQNENYHNQFQNNHNQIQNNQLQDDNVSNHSQLEF